MWHAFNGVGMIEDSFKRWYKDSYDLVPECHDFYPELLKCYKAGWKRCREVRRSENMISVEEVEEHEDGSATYSFHYDEATRDKLAGFGIELIIVCAAYGWDIQDALDHLKREVPESD